MPGRSQATRTKRCAVGQTLTMRCRLAATRLVRVRPGQPGGEPVPRLTVHRADPAADASVAEDGRRQGAPAANLTPLLIDRTALSVLLARSVPSIDRDDAAGRLPAALRVGGSKRWRYADIALWVEMGCPSRAEFEVRRTNHR